MRSDIGPWRLGGALRLALAIVLAASMSACSMVRIGYELVPWYTARHLDSYWQLDAVQSSFARERIDELWQWHRSSELPELARWLRQLSGRLDGPPSTSTK